MPLVSFAGWSEPDEGRNRRQPIIARPAYLFVTILGRNKQQVYFRFSA
jgi:hypothetical protein